jgi:hypothetical protein
MLYENGQCKILSNPQQTNGVKNTKKSTDPLYTKNDLQENLRLDGKML